MNVEKLISKAIAEYLDVEIQKDTGGLDFIAKVEIVKKRIHENIKADPSLFGMNLDENDNSYEMLFRSNPNDKIKIDGWIPVKKDQIRKLNEAKIEEYVAMGLLRKIEK